MLFFDTLNAFQRTRSLAAAIELEIFTAIGEGATTVAEIAARTNASERGVRILCDAMTVFGFLTKEDGHYALTPDTAFFLDKRSPAYLGGMTRFMLSPTLLGAYEGMAESVRSGTTALGPGGTVKTEHPVWVDFAHAMGGLARPGAAFMAETVALDPEKPARVLDVAAGHGVFGITFLERYPKAEVVALDWPDVLAVARENAEAAGVADRWTAKPGSAFEADFGEGHAEGYDVILMTNFLHHFDSETNTALMKKAHEALAPGGCAVTLEFCPNDDRVSPPIPALFALTMLASTPSGDAYTVSELEQVFADAGFSSTEAYTVPSSGQSVLVSRV
jgi:ubiquinone/menaquinone biosynthesis C-methylase UbiE